MKAPFLFEYLGLVMKYKTPYLALIFFMSFVANASVTMVNTRVIFTGDEKEKTVHLVNRESVPYLVQSWTEDKNFKETGDFIVMPPITKMKGKSTQSIRLKKNTAPNTSDVEDLYYYNFTQYPASDAKSQNKILFVVSTKVKIFVRPSGLSKTLEESINDVKITKANGKLKIDNPGPYHMSIFSLTDSVRKKIIKKNVLVKPKSTLTLSAPINGTEKIEIAYVDDYGAYKTLVY
ncbi:molecular chaperone [Cronobacter muytjensii]|uniref:molecular chaperone n=1 Tax=Cronobacter muytjensii TaxID=413501 RepID=UPI0034D5869E